MEKGLTLEDYKLIENTEEQLRGAHFGSLRWGTDSKLQVFHPEHGWVNWIDYYGPKDEDDYYGLITDEYEANQGGIHRGHRGCSEND